MPFWHPWSSWRISAFALQPVSTTGLDTMCLFLCRRTQINVLLSVICIFGRDPWASHLLSSLLIEVILGSAWVYMSLNMPSGLAFPMLCRSFNTPLCLILAIRALYLVRIISASMPLPKVSLWIALSTNPVCLSSGLCFLLISVKDRLIPLLLIRHSYQLWNPPVEDLHE